MSHVAQVEIEITNLDDLAAAAKRIGLEFVPGQQTYRWWGKHEGDYPLPPGFQEADLGRCDHALRIPQERAAELERIHGEPPYEIGIVRRRDGKPGWSLMWDFVMGGFGLTSVAGKDLGRLKQAYALAATRRTAIGQGFHVVREVTAPDGTVKLELGKR